MMTAKPGFTNRQPRLAGAKKHRKRTAKGDRKSPRKRLRQDIPNEGTLDENNAVVEEDVAEECQEECQEEDEPMGVEKTLEGQKHVHPCICDLTTRQRDKIKTYLNERTTMKKKYESRLKEIEDELTRMEEDRRAKERELQEQEQLFGDEYEIVGKKKRRKKRSARRASMVSLGVKQVINWKKPPRYPVKHTKASDLRKDYTSYCGRIAHPESPIGHVDYRKEPEIPVKINRSFEIRSKVNLQTKNELIKREDNRPRFVTCCF